MELSMIADSEEGAIDEDHRLFADIAREIRRSAAKYRKAGKWLDEYCCEDEAGERRTRPLLACFQKARDHLLEKYQDQQFITAEDARRVILITWLLTDSDAEKANLKITRFEKWTWEPLDDISKMSRGHAAASWRLGGKAYGPLTKLVRIAWNNVGSESPATEESSASILDDKMNLLGLTISRRNLISKLSMTALYLLKNSAELDR